MNYQSEYEQAIDKLNKLPSNAALIKESLNTQKAYKELRRDNTLRYLESTGYDKNNLEQLSVIHIAGTKGKGSTSSMCESILRAHGYKTGFFSSPHLISVTERIKLNGLSIGHEHFTKVFNEIYQQLEDNQKFEGDMPPYFGFLTVMALNIFITEKVDVAVIEVGIGGEYDFTNVVRNVPVIGITSLGYDHTNLLGNTIEEIAGQKAGIMKPGCAAYTTTQPLSAIKVLEKMAIKRHCSLNVVPPYESYNWLHNDVNGNDFKLTNPVKYLNASLAIQLAHKWMMHKDTNNSHNSSNKNCNIVVDVPIETFNGIKSNVWPGRCQLLKTEKEDYYIDGAHTEESIEVCCKWFKSQTRESSHKVLIFNITGDRDPMPLMKFLVKCNFDMVLFVPNVAYDERESKNLIDQVDVKAISCQQMDKCKNNSNIWKIVSSEFGLLPKSGVNRCINNVSAAFQFITSYYSDHNFKRPQILITGSLHLVGAALTVLDPFLNKS